MLIHSIYLILFSVVAGELVAVAAADYVVFLQERFHLHQPSMALFVKSEKSQFDQTVFDDTVVDNLADMLLGRVDSEPLELLAVVFVAPNIRLPVVLWSLVPLMDKQSRLVEVLLVSLFLVPLTYSQYSI